MKLNTCHMCNTYILEDEDVCVKCAVWDEAEANSINDFLDWELYSSITEEELEEMNVKIKW